MQVPKYTDEKFGLQQYNIRFTETIFDLTYIDIPTTPSLINT